MRWRKASLAFAATAAVCMSGTAHAARWHVGVFMGVPGPYYYPAVPVVPAPYYYAPPVLVQPAEPDVYIERQQTATMPEEATGPGSSGGTWWYCTASKTYYPYVKDCPSGWQEVPATPPPPRR